MDCSVFQMRLAIFLLLFSITGRIQGQDSTGLLQPNVVCFNDSGSGGKLGVFIYEGYSDWQIAREDPKSVLTFGFQSGKSAYDVSELSACLYVPVFDPMKAIPCTSGKLIVSNYEPGFNVTGSFLFEFEDGTTKQSDFSASFCPKRE